MCVPVLILFSTLQVYSSNTPSSVLSSLCRNTITTSERDHWNGPCKLLDYRHYSALTPRTQTHTHRDDEEELLDSSNTDDLQDEETVSA